MDIFCGSAGLHTHTHTDSGSNFPGADAKKRFPSWSCIVFLSSWSSGLQRQGTNSRGGAKRPPFSSSGRDC